MHTGFFNSFLFYIFFGKEALFYCNSVALENITSVIKKRPLTLYILKEERVVSVQKKLLQLLFIDISNGRSVLRLHLLECYLLISKSLHIKMPNMIIDFNCTFKNNVAEKTIDNALGYISFIVVIYKD